jgi:hypothetical protein
MSARSDLTAEEQANVRVALRFLRARCGSVVNLAKVLGFKDTTLGNVVSGRKPVGASVTFRAARLAKVGVDDLLVGKFPPPGACPHCGHCKDDAA